MKKIITPVRILTADCDSPMTTYKVLNKKSSARKIDS